MHTRRPHAAATLSLRSSDNANASEDSRTASLTPSPSRPVAQQQSPVESTGERKSALSKSAPTTPGGTKKHAHFDNDYLERRFSLQRRTTAPSSFDSSSNLPLQEYSESQGHHGNTMGNDLSDSDQDSLHTAIDHLSYGSDDPMDDNFDHVIASGEASDSQSENNALLGASRKHISDRDSDDTALFRSHSEDKDHTELERASSPRPLSTRSNASHVSKPPAQTPRPVRAADCAITHVNVIAQDDGADAESTISSDDEGETNQHASSSRGPSHPSGTLRTEKVQSKLAKWSRNNDGHEIASSPPIRLHGPGSRHPSGEEGVPAPPNTGSSSQVQSQSESTSDSQLTTPATPPSDSQPRIAIHVQTARPLATTTVTEEALGQHHSTPIRWKFIGITSQKRKNTRPMSFWPAPGTPLC
ncbi:hypothetical protein K461DRAFT_312729 [Myriangium duriaei CBS 260.36]|uniref:Uncharacterized protein n=1 Tax=Myriangium duriaei CBS 260.36 TaxID=1168546 RepID=A0A9P4J3B3_9PEZI|nr:hypothetical protein K461DRAFT_312729 [Myriangium duriaei CBS 260.36]